MSERQETTPLKSRAEKVRAFLRHPATAISLYVTGSVGVIATVFGASELAQMFAASGDPNGAIKTGLAAGTGGALSLAAMFASARLKSIFSDDSYLAKGDKKFLMFVGLPVSLAFGVAYSAPGYIKAKNALDALEQQKEIALLPAIDSAAIVKPEKIITTKKPAVTAFDAACQDNKKDWQEVKGMDGVSYRVNCSPK